MTQQVQSSPASTAPTGKTTGKALHIGLWVAQVLLALAFGMSGFMKLTTPYVDLVAKAVWATGISEALIKFIGIAEVAGALGMILPAATRIKPTLTPVAAVGFVVIMILAAFVHVSHGEPPVANVVLGGLAAFVAWGRFRKAPISPR